MNPNSEVRGAVGGAMLGCTRRWRSQRLYPIDTVQDRPAACAANDGGECGASNFGVRVKSLFVGQGLEHRVVAPLSTARVLKDYDPRVIDLETFEVFYKPAEDLFDYLTDHLLANHFFGDDIRLYGLYVEQSHLHLLISQPFIVGRHPAWDELVELLEAQGLQQQHPGSQQSRFWIDGGDAGQILVTDVHEDNVIVTQSRQAHPIDVHFHFLASLQGSKLCKSSASGHDLRSHQITLLARQQKVENGSLKSNIPSPSWTNHPPSP
jgi:Serine/Threonine/Tyrosine Kinase found in polyvalent proteins